MAGKEIAKSVKPIKVALIVNLKSTKDVGFYLDSSPYVHMIYDRLLSSAYSEVRFFPIRVADNSKLRVLGKKTVSLTIIIDCEALQVNFLNVLHSFDLEYNLLSVGTIEEAGYSVLAKNGRMKVFDNKDNIALVGTRIVTGYLVNVHFDGTYQALSSNSPTQNYAFWTE